jgi:hypothetical protein
VYSRDTNVHSLNFSFEDQIASIEVADVDLMITDSYLPASDTEKEAQHIRLLLLLKFFNIFEGTHL